jgi:hypothetical protein
MSAFRRSSLTFFVLIFLVFLTSSFAFAKKWNVYPSMDRTVIQAVIDTARDGDVIYFNSGLYDFSDGPVVDFWMNDGALRIYDKSLVIQGAPGAILQGAPSSGGWSDMKGISCFYVGNPNHNKDVKIDGLSIQTFMMGVFAVITSESPSAVYYPNLRNLTIKNCRFTDMHRNGISTAGIQGNITIADNTLVGVDTLSRFGIYFDWYFLPGQMEWQPKDTLVTIKGNSIRNYSWGIYNHRFSNVVIRDNTISTDRRPNYGSIGILFGNGLKKAATITNNILSNLAYGVCVWGYTEFLTGGVSHDSYATGVVMKNNNISGIWGDAIQLSGGLVFNNSFVYNTLELEDFWASRAIYSDGYDNQYKNNIIKGNCQTAVFLQGWDDTANSGLYAYPHNELFKANSISGLTSQLAHYTLDMYAHDNTVIGLETENATYTDSGTNNFFKYVYPYIPPATTGIAASKAGIPDKVKETGPKRGALPL